MGSVSPGPRFNDDGTFIAHSILGTAEDFAKELKEANMVRIQMKKMYINEQIWITKVCSLYLSPNININDPQTTYLVPKTANTTSRLLIT